MANTDVVPVAFELDGSYIWVGGVGPDVAHTRKLRNIGAGRTEGELVVDDLVSMQPFIARALRVYGERGAADRAHRHGRPGVVLADHPDRFVELEPRRRTGRGAVVSRPANGAHRLTVCTPERVFDPVAAGHVTLSSCRQAEDGRRQRDLR